MTASQQVSTRTAEKTIVDQTIADDEHVVFVVFGASGDLAKKKTYPALFGLAVQQLLPENYHIVGYARSELALDAFRNRLEGYLPSKEGGPGAKTQFLERCSYVHGGYDDEAGFRRLLAHIESLEKGFSKGHRAYYLATPPTVFAPAAAMIRRVLYRDEAAGWQRIVVEKPFGRDTETSHALVASIAAHWDERNVFRIDHYLGKEMVKSFVILRFANMFFGAVWNRHCIDNVQITFKEAFGAEGRGGYFDNYGIIRDVMQNHLLQVVTLLAMERPVSLASEDIRNEKVKVLRLMEPLRLDDTLLGQYAASSDGKHPAYTADPTVPDDSRTCTFAATVVRIANERWAGVPFLLRCGKALNETKTEVRVQFRDCPGNIFGHELARNELVLRVQPQEAVYMKFMNKVPGLAVEPHITELDLSYSTRYASTRIPAAYEALLLDMLKGDQSNFVRSDELDAAWRIFTPLLHEIDSRKIAPELYPYGSRGPAGVNAWAERHGVQHTSLTYDWKPSSGPSSPNKL